MCSVIGSFTSTCATPRPRTISSDPLRTDRQRCRQRASGPAPFRHLELRSARRSEPMRHSAVGSVLAPDLVDLRRTRTPALRDFLSVTRWRRRSSVLRGRPSAERPFAHKPLGSPAAGGFRRGSLLLGPPASRGTGADGGLVHLRVAEEDGGRRGRRIGSRPSFSSSMRRSWASSRIACSLTPRATAR